MSLLTILIILVIIALIFGGFGVWGGPGWGYGVSFGPVLGLIVLIIVLWALGVFR